MPQCPITEVAPFLPHSGRMVLLDSILDYDEQHLSARATICANHILLPVGADALPAHLGMEIMAQGVAAWAGVQAADRGEAVRLGFLLGTRKLHIGCPTIPVGTVLAIEVVQSWQDNSGMGVFDCTLNCVQAAAGFEQTMPVGMELLGGSLNVFSPRSDEALAQLLHADAE